VKIVLRLNPHPVCIFLVFYI